MPQTILPENLARHEGENLGVSEWTPVLQTRIDEFAEATGDHQFIHVDPVQAAATPFGGTIAHGMLTLSMALAMLPPGYILLDGLTMAVNYGFDKVRMISPVRTGSLIRARYRFVGATDRGGGQWLVRNEITVEIQGFDKPALIAESLVLQVTTG